jgi:Flp pilus assembly CpaE family ATPase
VLVVNRENSRGAIARADIEENLKLKVAVGIRSDGRTLVKAINAGEPAVAIDRRSRLARGVRQIITLITTGQGPAPGTTPVAPIRANRGLLTRLVRR